MERILQIGVDKIIKNPECQKKIFCEMTRKGELYVSFVHKRALVKYQSQSEVIFKAMLYFYTCKKTLKFENSNS